MKDGYLRDLRDIAEQQGWRIQQTASSHWQWLPPDKSQSPVIQAHTPSDYRGVQNFLSRLRKRGLKIPK
jgi:hypothetical protein